MLFEIIILVLAFPIGYLIAWMARDELIAGRKWFLILMAIGIVGGVLSFILGFNYGNDNWRVDLED